MVERGVCYFSLIMAIARVQSKVANTGTSVTSTTLAITLDNPTVSGHVVMVGIATTTTSVLKVTSTNGIFSDVTPTAADISGVNLITHLFYGVMLGADTVITVASSVPAGVINVTSAIAVEYSGALILPDNIPAVIGASSTNAANTGNLSNTNANALFVGVIGIKTQSSTQNTNWATNNVAPFSIVAQITSNNGTVTTIDRALVYLDAIVSTSSTRGANINHGFGTNRYAGLLATFDQAASGGGIRAAGHGGLAA